MTQLLVELPVEYTAVDLKLLSELDPTATDLTPSYVTGPDLPEEDEPRAFSAYALYTDRLFQPMTVLAAADCSASISEIELLARDLPASIVEDELLGSIYMTLGRRSSLGGIGPYCIGKTVPGVL